MKKKPIVMIAAVVAIAVIASIAGCSRQKVKLGVIFGFTGPIESLTPPMAVRPNSQ